MTGVAKLGVVVCARRCQDSPDFLKAALAATGDVVLVIDDQGTIEFASAAAVRVLGRPAGSYHDRSLFDLVHQDDRAALVAELGVVVDGSARRARRRSRIRAAHAGGRWIDLEATILPPSADEEGTETMLVLRDVTELAAAEREVERARAQFEFLMAHDPMTGLPNLNQLEQVLDELCHDDADGDSQTPLLMAAVVDVDELRDTYGMREMESVVRTVGRSVRTLAKPGYFVAAVGVGELVVVGEPGTPAAEFDEFAKTLSLLADTPMIGRIMQVAPRLAVARSTLDPSRGTNAALDRLARAARYACTTGARAPVVVGDVAADAPGRTHGAAEVAQALATGRLELHFQPIRDVDSGRVAGFEGLLRWNHPDHGLLAAGEFLPVVEDSELIVDIGAFVFEQGCAQLARWQQAYGPYAPMLSLNVSARQLREADFSDLVRRELERAGADPSGLCLELTDTHVFDREPEVMAELQRVRSTGTKIALDEFGTGSSSLYQLQQLGADVLKIDKAFVHQVGLDDGATAIVRAAIEFGVAFGMTTIAEGVTTVEQHRLLLSLGCDRVQGFLIAPALPADLADAMLSAESALGRPAAADGEHDHVTVQDARGRLALIDEQYLPSEDEVAALAGVSAFAARSGLNRTGREALS